MKLAFAISAVLALLTACTHASISSIPMELEGIGTVYRYQGRANFAHQMAEADRMITEDCKARNGGRPVIVDMQKRDLGIVALNSAQATTRLNATTTGTAYGANTTGIATTNSLGSTTALRNYNQEVVYKCVKE